MPDKEADPTAAARTAIVFSQIDSLSILPAVAVELLTALADTQQPAELLSRIISPEPALSAKILSILHQQGINFAEENFSIRQAIEKLPPALIRNVLFSLKLVPSDRIQQQSAVTAQALLVHCLAVACCAREIAEIITPKMNPHLAFSAGLLHDIGKIAIQQIMPKSFARIAEEAESQNACSCEVERQYLGLPHTIIGKRLAHQWHLPEQIVQAIWLHHTDTTVISLRLPQARIASIVQLADLIARQSGTGLSASYDSTDPTQMARNLGIQPEQIRQICGKLNSMVEKEAKILSLDSPEPESAYSQAIRAAASNLAGENAKLAEQNRRLHIAGGCLDFATDLLLGINSADSLFELMTKFARQWQNYYQTGQLCLYLKPAAGSQTVDAVLIEGQGKARMLCLNPPAQKNLLPPQISRDFAILQADENLHWLFEQLDVDFELSQTKILPLLCSGKAIGAIVFELRYPVDIKKLEQSFSVTCKLGAAILEIAIAGKNQQNLCETFAELITPAPGPPRQTEPAAEAAEAPPPVIELQSQLLTALSEMAAGAAHELNNPLSVVAGRTQLLGKAETDSEKKKNLDLINKNTNEISRIINDLMSFAQPPAPRPTPTPVRQIIDEAIELTKQKTGLEGINIQVGIAEPNKTIFVDSAQIASATANILCNAIESYGDSPGPVKVTDAADKQTNSVKIIVSDFGCGMDKDTSEKATHPFFSAKPAGRKRGMGLAHASRLIQLNQGRLKIESKPASGTTVTVNLPAK